jgi:hypothetical protein
MSLASRRSVAAVVLTALALTTAACASSSTKIEVLRLRSANPLTSDLYVRISGPAGAVNYLAHGLTAGAFSTGAGGSFVPPTVRRRKACSFSHTIGYGDAASLQAWRGRKIRIAVFGNRSYAATYCQGIGPAFTSGS